MEVVALNLTAEALGIDSENYLFHKLVEYRSSFTNVFVKPKDPRELAHLGLARTFVQARAEGKLVFTQLSAAESVCEKRTFKNVFVKPNEQSQTCLSFAMARKRLLKTNLISRRQYNDRKKATVSLCESIRKNVAMEMDGSEDMFCIDSKPIEFRVVPCNAWKPKRTCASPLYTCFYPQNYLHSFTEVCFDLILCALRVKDGLSRAFTASHISATQA